MTNNFKAILLILCCSTFLAGCFSGKQLVNIKNPDGEMGVSSYTTVKPEDKVMHVSVGAEIEANVEMSANFGFKFLLGSFKGGMLSGNFHFQNIDRFNVFEDYVPDKYAPSNHFSANYSYPLFKKEKKGKAKILLIDQNSSRTGYTIDNNSKYLQILSIEGGLGYSSDNFRTTKWADEKVLQSSEEIYFSQGLPKGNAYVNQGVVSGYCGLKLSNFVNTFISGDSDGLNFRGRKKDLLDIRLGARPLIYSFSDEIDYKYNVGTGSQSYTVEESVSPSSFLNKSLVGHTLGIYYTIFTSNAYWSMPITYYGEWGVPPGYKEKYFNTMYLRFGIMLGFAPNG